MYLLYVNEYWKKLYEDNECFEFFGDVVLELIVL